METITEGAWAKMTNKRNKQTLARVYKDDLIRLRNRKRMLMNGKQESDADTIKRLLDAIDVREKELMKKANALDIRLRFDKKNVYE